VDEDAEEAEEEGLLASTGRIFEASRQDITGRADRESARLSGSAGRLARDGGVEE
jgi:LMBR1 domain-containing protein 1